QAGLLQGDAEHFAQLARVALPGATQDAHFARSRRKQTFENLDSCRLAGAVRSEQPEAFAFANLEVDPAQGFHLAVIGLAEAVAFDRQRHPSILANCLSPGTRLNADKLKGGGGWSLWGETTELAARFIGLTNSSSVALAF